MYLATDHDRPWYKVGMGIRFDAVIHGDHVETVQELTLVLVDTFDLPKEKRNAI